MPRLGGNQRTVTGFAQDHHVDINNADANAHMSHFTMTNVRGDLATVAPENSVLIHSCNCIGQWGSGVGQALATAFPGAVDVYREHCQSHKPEQLLGTCLLMWAQEDGPGDRFWWIACLFVSEGYGKRSKNHARIAKPAAMTRHTRSALYDLKDKLEHYRQDPEAVSNNLHMNTGEIYACKFNSGYFGVPWENTVQVIEEVFQRWDGRMKVVSPN